MLSLCLDAINNTPPKSFEASLSLNRSYNSSQTEIIIKFVFRNIKLSRWRIHSHPHLTQSVQRWRGGKKKQRSWDPSFTMRRGKHCERVSLYFPELLLSVPWCADLFWCFWKLRQCHYSGERKKIFANYTSMAKKYSHPRGKFGAGNQHLLDHTMLKYTGKSGLSPIFSLVSPSFFQISQNKSRQIIFIPGVVC